MTPEEHKIKQANKKKKNRERKKQSKRLAREEVSTDRHQDSESQPAPENNSNATPTTAVDATQKLSAALSSEETRKQQPEHKRKKPKLSGQHLKVDVSNSTASCSTEESHPRYSFEVDDTDHCETPLQAYRDILDVLDRLAKSLHKTRATLRIYDPYYCDGGVKKKLASFGFTSVINRNRDFYDDIDKNLTPGYDVLVTNPPYSGMHMEKILAFCSECSTKTQKPFLLLLPHFVYTKDYYQRALSLKVSSSVFFLVPEARYGYIPPAWVEEKMGSKALEQGKTITAPFPSFWYCHSSKDATIPSDWLIQNFGPSGMIRPKHHSKLRYAKSSKDIPRDFKGEFDLSKKRPNPKARKKAAKIRREAAMKAGGR